MRTENLIKALYECAAHCDHCAIVCLNASEEEMTDCIRLADICAAACCATAESHSAQTSDADVLLEVCLEICAKCAAECDKYGAEHCRLCAEACRRCIAECSQDAA